MGRAGRRRGREKDTLGLLCWRGGKPGGGRWELSLLKSGLVCLSELSTGVSKSDRKCSWGNRRIDWQNAEKRRSRRKRCGLGKRRLVRSRRCANIDQSRRPPSLSSSTSDGPLLCSCCGCVHAWHGLHSCVGRQDGLYRSEVVDGVWDEQRYK
eukprot:6177197-Pleurochrysis_carterae.AAC.1